MSKELSNILICLSAIICVLCGIIKLYVLIVWGFEDKRKDKR